MQRRVEPEILDTLSPDDPRARGSRRDLNRVNWIMGNARVLAKALAAAAPAAPARIIDLGAGDGALSLGLARRLTRRWPAMRLTLVDRAPAVERATLAAIRATGWQAESVAADAFDWCGAAGDDTSAAGGDAFVANLFLHHFEAPALQRLFGLLAPRAAIFAAAEPRRNLLALTGSRLLGLIGCNAVTRHDAVVSVRAGFAGKEISALWPETGGWRLGERPFGLASHLFVAARGAG